MAFIKSDSDFTKHPVLEYLGNASLSLGEDANTLYVVVFGTNSMIPSFLENGMTE